VSREEIVTRFLENAVRAAAGATFVEDRKELPRLLSERVPEGAAVYCPARSDLEKEVVSVFPHRVDDCASAEVTVEEVLAGIAETGSIVCASLEGRAVQASVLPSRHVALLPAAKIFPTLDEFFAACGSSPPTNLAVITGPSRTADIELTLAIGVHGPERLDVLVI
jgi:L-lactate dehydrogenase complex protein LldG